VALYASKQLLQRREWIANGLCGRCGQVAVSGVQECEGCRKKQSVSFRNWYYRRKAQGKCLNCGVADALEGQTQCLACKVKRVLSGH